jgi:hypothetical protein
MRQGDLNFSIFQLFQQVLLMIISHRLWYLNPYPSIALEYRNLLQICDPISNMHYIGPKNLKHASLNFQKVGPRF